MIEVARKPPEESAQGPDAQVACTNCGHLGWLHHPGPQGLCYATNGKVSGSSSDNACACPGFSKQLRT